MVSATEKPRRRDASCCSAAVVNGGSAWRLSSSRSTEATVNDPARTRAAASLAAASDARPASPIRVPSSSASTAPNRAPSGVASSASTLQCFRAAKPSISASRSHSSLSATDCTRPAERQPGSLRHSTGDRP